MQEAAGLLGIAWGKRHTDARRDDDLVTVELEWLNQRREQPATERLRLTRPLDAHLDQRELVAAEPGDGVGLPHARFQASGTELEEPVAGRMSEGIVDALEAVEVDQQNRGHAVAAPESGQRLLEALTQQLAVRQLRHGVMQGEVVGALLGCYLGRDVAGRAPIAMEAAKTVESGLAGETQDPALIGAVLDPT